jgi:hypothetical protein
MFKKFIPFSENSPGKRKLDDCPIVTKKQWEVTRLQKEVTEATEATEITELTSLTEVPINGI